MSGIRGTTGIIVMSTFDKGLLSATIDANGIAWVTYAGPPFTLWQLLESNAVGAVTRRSSADSSDVLEPIFRAGPCCWILCLQYCGEGVPPSFPLATLAQVALTGINALSERYPAISTDWNVVTEGVV
jgi:hypothetical protein